MKSYLSPALRAVGAIEHACLDHSEGLPLLPFFRQDSAHMHVLKETAAVYNVLDSLHNL